MKTVFTIVLTLSFSLSAYSASWLDALGFGTKSTNQSSSLPSSAASSLSQDQVIAGLKEALGKGVQQAISQLGHEGGFLTNLNESTRDEAKSAAVENAPPKHIRIWVQDDGIGIPREAHQKIFGIFERGATSDAYEGTGIGLAIVARAMERMGGTCGVESGAEEGSRFWLELLAA